MYRQQGLPSYVTGGYGSTVGGGGASPAGPGLRHGDGADALAGGHGGDEALHLLCVAVVTDVGHDDVRVQSEPRAGAVTVHPVKQQEVQLEYIL